MAQADDLEGVRGLFEAFLADTSYEWYRRNDLVHYEGCRAALMYPHFAAAGPNRPDTGIVRPCRFSENFLDKSYIPHIFGIYGVQKRHLTAASGRPLRGYGSLGPPLGPVFGRRPRGQLRPG